MNQTRVITVPPPLAPPKPRHRTLAIAIAIICILVGSTAFAYGAWVMLATGNVVVQPAHAEITGALITIHSSSGTAGTCTISTDKQSVTCTDTAIYPGHGNRATLNMTVKNDDASGTISLSATADTSSHAVATIAANDSYPITLAAGASVHLYFDITGVAGGTTTFTVTINGT